MNPQVFPWKSLYKSIYKYLYSKCIFYNNKEFLQVVVHNLEMLFLELSKM